MPIAEKAIVAPCTLTGYSAVAGRGGTGEVVSTHENVIVSWICVRYASERVSLA